MTLDPRPADDLSFDQISVGDIFELERSFTRDDVDRFAELSGDFSPLHVDENYAQGTEFGQRVVHGMLLASLFSNLVGMRIPGRPALYLGQELAFRKPVFIGDALTARGKVTAKNAATSTISLAMEIRNQDDKVVVSGTGKVKVRDTETARALPDQTEEEAPASVGSDRPVAVITGGSKGIGAAVARKLAAQDYHCVVVYRSSVRDAESLCAGIRESGGSVAAFQCDVTRDDDLDALNEMLTSRFGRVDALVNCAIGDLNKVPLTDLSWDDFDGYLQTQVNAVVGLSQRLFPMMREQGKGSIVNILSQVVHNAPPTEFAHYVTAKYALMGLSKSMAVEWARQNIRVNMVSPGLARTALTQHYQDKLFKMEALKTPLGRLVELEDVANAVSYLISDDAAFITGSNLMLTGGQDMP